MNKSLITSYVLHNGKCFFVSTINRESSAMEAHGMTYAETMAWELDLETKKNGNIVAQDEAATDSLRGHFRVCEKLFVTGKFYEDEE
jgi:hypothetical protein